MRGQCGCAAYHTVKEIIVLLSSTSCAASRSYNTGFSTQTPDPRERLWEPPIRRALDLILQSDGDGVSTCGSVMANCGLGALPQYCSGVLLAGLARPCSGGCFTVLAWEPVLCIGLWAGSSSGQPFAAPLAQHVAVRCLGCKAVHYVHRLKQRNKLRSVMRAVLVLCQLRLHWALIPKNIRTCTIVPVATSNSAVGRLNCIQIALTWLYYANNPSNTMSCYPRSLSALSCRYWQSKHLATAECSWPLLRMRFQDASGAGKGKTQLLALLKTRLLVSWTGCWDSSAGYGISGQ